MLVGIIKKSSQYVCTYVDWNEPNFRNAFKKCDYKVLTAKVLFILGGKTVLTQIFSEGLTFFFLLTECISGKNRYPRYP